MAKASITDIGMAATVVAATDATGGSVSIDGDPNRVRIDFYNEDATEAVYVDTEGANDITLMHRIPPGTDPGNPLTITSLPQGGDLLPTQGFYLRCDTAQTANVRVTEYVS